MERLKPVHEMPGNGVKLDDAESEWLICQVAAQHLDMISKMEHPGSSFDMVEGIHLLEGHFVRHSPDLGIEYHENYRLHGSVSDGSHITCWYRRHKTPLDDCLSFPRSP